MTNSTARTEKIVVLGSNSFSGSHFVDHALFEGAEVVGISRSPEPPAAFLPYDRPGNRKFRFFQLDLNHHMAQIVERIRSEEPDYVVNFAAQSMVAESWLQPEQWFQTNVVATVKLHDRLRKFDFLKKYIHVSTPEVYGSCSGMVRESADYRPSTPYAVSRAAADMSLASFHKAYGFPVVFTRAANVYGPGQQLYRIVPKAILCFLTGQKLPLHGGGHSVRAFIHIQDVADATLRIARRGTPGEIYHLSTQPLISIRDLVEKIAEHLGVDFDAHVEITGERMGKDHAYMLDSTKARDELGWTASVDIDQGIDETIQWARKHIDLLRQWPTNYQHKP